MVKTCRLPLYKFSTPLAWRDVYDSKVLGPVAAREGLLRADAPALRPSLHPDRPGRRAPALPGAFLQTPLVSPRHPLVHGLATPPGRRHDGSRRAEPPPGRGRCVGPPPHSALPSDPFPGHHRLQRRPPPPVSGLGGGSAGRPGPPASPAHPGAPMARPGRAPPGWFDHSLAPAGGRFPRSSARTATNTRNGMGA